MRKWNENRFFIDSLRPKIAGRITIDDKEQIKHISGALRLGVGDKVELCFKDELECIAGIEEISKEAIHLKNIENCVISKELPAKIDLYQGVPKLKKIDLIVQKATECGVNSITPLNMQNCVANIKAEKKDKKRERLQKIAYSAAEQCKRLYVPKVNNAIDFKDMIDILSDYDLVIVADEDLSAISEGSEPKTLKTIEDKIKTAKSIAVIVGAEGGLADYERDMLKDIAESVSLGSRILRTETAGMFILAQLNYIFS